MPPRSVKMNRLHLRVPAAGLVAEVDSGLQQLSHGDDSHVCFLSRFELSVQPAGLGRNRLREPAPPPGRVRRVGGTDGRRANERLQPRARSSAAARSAGSGDSMSTASPVSGCGRRAAPRAGTGARGRVAGDAVGRVAGDRQADRGEVDADLVRPARLEPHAQQRVLAAAARSTSKCVTASRGVSVSSERRVGSRRSRPIGASIRPARERGRPRTSARYSRSSSRAPHERLQRARTPRRARDDQQARRVAVEPVDDARPVRSSPPATPRASSPCTSVPLVVPGAGMHDERRRACRRRAGARPRRRWRASRLRRRAAPARAGGVDLELLPAREPVALRRASPSTSTRAARRAAARPPRASRPRAARARKRSSRAPAAAVRDA